MRERVRILYRAMAVAAALPALHGMALAQSPCGATAIAAAGETLADVAERCDVTLEALRDANPTLTGDVAEGTSINVPAETDAGADAEPAEETDILARASDLLRD